MLQKFAAQSNDQVGLLCASGPLSGGASSSISRLMDTSSNSALLVITPIHSSYTWASSTATVGGAAPARSWSSTAGSALARLSSSTN